MRKLIVGTFISLDGVMQAPGGPEEDTEGGFAYGGWVFPHFDEAVGEFVDELFAEPFDLLLGRKTYDIFAAYWPFQEGEPIAAKFNAATKFVATSSVEPLAWHNSVALRGNVPAEIARLKAEDGPNLVVQGSSRLLQALFANALVDELRLLVFPLMLGKGKRLFGEGTTPSGLRLVSTSSSNTGVVMSHYLPDGAVRTGSFAQAEPSEAELARREKMRMEEA
jgi:dihydrofolate reductase